ncbi:uncharacterized protein LOC133328092 [Musca vetustissima]|uniref:uncharacterized protein LOC133328092 n=1 Tax=Musca vetustissima TaxID=27455 RepID=UPI002AB7435F|nr:uncharacterized protein LOC133328092 [Musca vetustissima]
MGCCSSTNANETLNGYYAATAQQRQGSKRSYSSRISTGSSSGVSSACTSPSRRSILSRSSSTNSSPNGPKAKTKNFTLTHKDIPSKALEMLSICDDFGEVGRLQNKSYGYYSESSSPSSSPSKNCLRRTQDTSSLTSEEPDVAVTPTPSDLEMEMYMMSHSQGLMPKTSSPIFQRRDVTYDAVAQASPPSQSYQKWSNYLQSTPAYMLHNVTNIPEAIAGHFSPMDFPGFTDLEDMESAAKRFKADIHKSVAYESAEEDEVFYQKQIPRPSNLTHTISTEL